MSSTRILAIALTSGALAFVGCTPVDSGSPSGQASGGSGGSESGGSGGKSTDTGGRAGTQASGGSGGSNSNESGGSGGSGGTSSSSTSSSSGGSGGSSTSSSSGGSGGTSTSTSGGGSGGTSTTSSTASGGTTGTTTTTTPPSTTACPGTPITIDWANGWMDPIKNPAIHGAWYTYGDTNGTTFTPPKGGKVTTNCLTGTIAAAGWGAGFGFNVNQQAGSEAKPVWATPPAKICFEVELTGASGFVELPMTKVDVHAPPYGQPLVNGVNMVDLSKVTPTWTGAASPGTWNPADVAEIHLKVAKPGTEFKLCVKGMSVQ